MMRERLRFGLQEVRETGHQSFDIHIEYIASPSIDDKTLILADPMLATGASMELTYRALLTKGTPRHIHVATIVASRQAIDYCKRNFPSDKTTIWAAVVDPELNDASYIVPGLGDAGDLAYGEKAVARWNRAYPKPTAAARENDRKSYEVKPNEQLLVNFWAKALNSPFRRTSRFQAATRKPLPYPINCIQDAIML